MIVAEQKPITEIMRMLTPYDRVLILGCGTCMTVCDAGGEREVSYLQGALRVAEVKSGDGTHTFSEYTLKRQCDPEFLDLLIDRVADVDAILSLGCGIGAQTLAERFPDKRVVPGLNTTFMGVPTEQGVWEERCQACGDCVLGLTGGICPISRCSKQLLNGPCGGSQQGQCEIDPEVPCAWQLIWERMAALGLEDRLMEIQPPKNWSTSRDGGPRRIIRDDLQLPEDYQE